MVTIPKAEYEHLKEMAKMDYQIKEKVINMEEEIIVLRNSKLYKRLLEFERNIANGKKFARKDLGF